MGRRVTRRRVVQALLLAVGLVGIAFTISATMHKAKSHVMPSAPAIAAAAVLAFSAAVCSGHAWVALFGDEVTTRASRTELRGTFYLAQLTKYLPAGGFVQAASQVGLGRQTGMSLKRVAVAFPVSVVVAVVAGATIGAGASASGDLPGWLRACVLLGLLSLVLLHRRLLARVVDLAHQFFSRVPTSEHLPSQREILAFYVWALATMASLCAAYTVLLHSVDSSVNPFVVACAFAVSWVVGFLAVPIPAGVGIREAVLVVLLPGVGAAPLLAASLVLRLLSIGGELVALGGNRLLQYWHARRATSAAEVH
jgi:uncharacterized membrane protein YbhN (UPF0104 family)